MRDKKILVLVVLMIAVIISVVRAVLMMPPSNPSNSSSPLNEKISLDGQIALYEKHSMPQKITETKYKSWGRNPFNPIVVTSDNPESRLVLQGILFESNSSKSKAVINGRIVGVDDTVGKFRVIDIHEDFVVVDDGGKEIELKM